MALQSKTYDPRYTEHCRYCHKVLGSWATHATDEEKVCYDCHHGGKPAVNKLINGQIYK